MKHIRKDQGFTLVELMVVVLIIGILVAIAVPIFNAAKATAQKNTCFANQRVIEGAAQSYQAGTGSFPANVAAMYPAYLKAVPTCPGGGAAYSINSSGTVAACTVHGAYQ